MLFGDSKKLTPFTDSRQNSEILNCTIKPFSVHELFFFPGYLKKKINQTDLFYSPYFNIPPGITVPVYTTIHDIIFPDMPELTSRTGLALRMWFYRRAFRFSEKIFTVSNFSKSRIEYYSNNTKPVIVTYSAIQPYLLEGQKEKVNKKKYILFIGNIKKHKGLWCLLDAFFQARDEGLAYRLLIIGNKDNFRSQDTESLRKLDSIDASIVEFTGSVSNKQLMELLTNAALLVQPSLYEGFGLPPLEAMICGTTPLLSDIPVFKEIYDGFPVTFFRTGDSRDLKDKLMTLLFNKKGEILVLPEHLAAKYTFKKTASVILQELTGI
ncbi:MAG: glycosyltransferase family 4 protein [Treponema sp.]|nr:glycosyltransferase family 4 protein [Treponema sp.]